MISICLDAEQLRKALSAIEAAEANGFMYCLAVVDVTQVGPSLDNCRGSYSHLVERAHPTDPDFNWGCYQGVTRRNKFENGRLVAITNGR